MTVGDGAGNGGITPGLVLGKGAGNGGITPGLVRRLGGGSGATLLGVGLDRGGGSGATLLDCCPLDVGLGIWPIELGWEFGNGVGIGLVMPGGKLGRGIEIEGIIGATPTFGAKLLAISSP